MKSLMNYDTNVSIILIQNGADLECRNKNGFSSLDMVFTMNDKEV